MSGFVSSTFALQHRLMLLAVSLLLPLPPDSLKVFQWNARGLRARSTKLLHFPSSHSVDLICIQESNLNSSSFFLIPGFSSLQSDCTHFRSGILSPDAIHASSGIIIFVRQGLSFTELSTSSLSSLDPYSDYVGVNISLSHSSLLSFLNVYAPLFSLLRRRMSEPTPFLPPFFPSPEISILGDFNCHHPSGIQKVLLAPVRRKYSIRSSLLTSSPSTTLIYLLFRIAPLAVATPLTSPLLPPLSLYLSPGRCFRTWILITNHFSFFSLSPQRRSLPSIFRKLAGMTLPFTLIFTVFLQRNTRLFLFLLLLLSLLL